MTNFPDGMMDDPTPSNDYITDSLFAEDGEVEDGAEIKEEPTEATNQSTWAFNSGEVISLLTDDEGDDLDAFGRPPRPEAQFQLTPLTDGSSAQKKKEINEMIMKKQRDLAQRFREKKQAPAISEAQKDLNNFDGAEMAANDDARSKQAQEIAAAQFEKLKQQFYKKKKAKTLTIKDEIEFMKAESAEAARLRKVQADLDWAKTPSADEGEGFFISEGEEPSLPSFGAICSDGDGETVRNKRKRHIDESDDERPRKRGRPKATRKSTPGKTKSTPRKHMPPGMLNTSSLFETDVFHDAAAMASRGSQPIFNNQSRRSEALKELLASIPTEDQPQARSDKKSLEDAIKAFSGQASVKPAADGHWRVAGMKSSLKAFQVLGAGWLRRKENGSHEPRGGIQADQMGLGKTLQMLANVINGKPKVGSKQRATLIVAPASLIQQWANEISAHCYTRQEDKKHGLGMVLQYRAGARPVGNGVQGILESSDIVLSTYQEVSKNYPKDDIPAELVTSKQKEDWWKDYYEQERGILHRIHWHRVVLDEGQAIKNHRSHTANACSALNAKHRWIMSGTPLQNKVTTELYSYFRFLRQPYTGTFKIFKTNFCIPQYDNEGTERLTALLSTLMIRRTHADTLFECRLLDLPEPRSDVVWLGFNPVERQIYNIVKYRFATQINKRSKQGVLEHRGLWTLILRLRQMTAHILLVQDTIVDLLEREDFEKLNRITGSEDEMSEESTALILHLRKVLDNTERTRTMGNPTGNGTTIEIETFPNGVIDMQESEGNAGGKHGQSFHFRKYLDSLCRSEQWDAIVQRSICMGCRERPESPQLTSCNHLYCLECLQDLQHRAARRGYDHARCVACNESFSSAAPCVLPETRKMRQDDTPSSSNDLQGGRKAKAGKDKDEFMEDWISMKGEIVPSAKTQAVKAQILEWFKSEDPKVIVYTQFLKVIRILQTVCRGEGWESCCYTGEMSLESRDKALQDFAQNPQKKILLASLKAGGVGLNLTYASRVILIDPYWNEAVEQQAFCRVFRIGQVKETSMTRLVVRDTIDEALMAMKERKQVEIDEVMESQNNEKPTIQELLSLFGRVGEDAEGHPFIFAEDEQDGEDSGHPRLIDLDEDEDQFMRSNS